MKDSINYEINKELGECYLFMGEYEKAKEYYEKAIVCDSDRADPFMGLAAIALGEGNLEEAHAHYTKADALGSTAKTLVGLGMVEMELGKHEQAFAHFEKSLEHDPVNMIAINSVIQLGYVLKTLDRVIPLLEKAIIKDESLEAVRYALAGCLTSLGREAEAKTHLETILGANPDNAQAQNLYAGFSA